ncbi:hypothetical protein GALMADRAFT_1133051 [Galerina marginata CBS 339.88]|uniref:Uncharacterized protein n=1 Tax=Galerina marginata (strain CBS 339.88) TaxID=685588 RepID=A0A067S823_GALM3|nr:hypothetical protein GALMADRAFT_1133051 [Galerina marginata CBS 339.88]
MTFLPIIGNFSSPPSFQVFSYYFIKNLHGAPLRLDYALLLVLASILLPCCCPGRIQTQRPATRIVTTSKARWQTLPSSPL